MNRLFEARYIGLVIVFHILLPSICNSNQFVSEITHQGHQTIIRGEKSYSTSDEGNGTKALASRQIVNGVQEIIHLRTTQIIDAQGWGQPVPVKTLLIPADWHTKGGVTWRNTYCTNNLTAENFVASSPDGSMVFETLPGFYWMWAYDQISQATIRMSGCILAPPRGPEAVLKDIIANYRPGAYIRSVESSPNAARAVREDLFQLYGPYYNARGISLRTDALRAVIEYRLGGGDYEEWITFSWIEATEPTLAAQPVYHYFFKDVAAFRTPKRELKKHERLFSTILASTHINPVWLNAMIQLIANVSTNASIAAGNRAAIWRNAINQIGEMRVRTWHQNQETLSRVSTSWSEAFRGVDSYLDPVSQQSVELPTGYSSAWGNGMGGYVLSPNPSFDPNTNPGLKDRNWHRLEAPNR